MERGAPEGRAGWGGAGAWLQPCLGCCLGAGEAGAGYRAPGGAGVGGGGAGEASGAGEEGAEALLPAGGGSERGPAAADGPAPAGSARGARPGPRGGLGAGGQVGAAPVPRDPPAPGEALGLRAGVGAALAGKSGPVQRLREGGGGGGGGHRRVGSGSVAAFLPEPEPSPESPDPPGKAGGDELELLSLKARDECPICLEPYTSENPAIVTACKHRFHLSCLYEWVERSDTCAMCLSPLVGPLEPDGGSP